LAKNNQMLQKLARIGGVENTTHKWKDIEMIAEK
jgi:hypothetical protein